jgi:hypothetical protein
MAINTPSTAGQVLTSSYVNALPFGLAGLQTLTTVFTTSPTHTNPQANGMTLTITEVSGRRYKITANSNIYPSGGLQGVNMSIVRAGTPLKQGNFAPAVMDAGNAFPVLFSFIYTATTSGSATYTTRIWAASANTAVSDYADATFPRQFSIEDLGPA